MVKKG